MVNVGESLVAVGFGTIENTEKSIMNKETVAYFNKLKNAELQLEKKQLGLKYYIKPTKLVLNSMYKNISKVISRSKAMTSKKVPKAAVA